jgi:hypothetical protein
VSWVVEAGGNEPFSAYHGVFLASLTSQSGAFSFRRRCEKINAALRATVKAGNYGSLYRFIQRRPRGRHHPACQNAWPAPTPSDQRGARKTSNALTRMGAAGRVLSE